ncbi:MAG: 3-keto-5-aminohexanoate cleavage protein, partial [Acidobacteriota bacterium]
MEKLIITAALTGGVTVPTQTPYLPYTPQQIIDQAVECAEVGAASVHIHARRPADGMPIADPELFGEYLQGIKARSNVIV